MCWANRFLLCMRLRVFKKFPNCRRVGGLFFYAPKELSYPSILVTSIFSGVFVVCFARQRGAECRNADEWRMALGERVLACGNGQKDDNVGLPCGFLRESCLIVEKLI